MFALLGALLAAYLLFLISRRSWHFSPLLDGWLVVGFELVASGLCAAAGFRRRRRRVAFVLGGACLAWALGDLTLTLESLGGATPPTPSLADLFYLSFFPLALIAVALFTRGEIRRGDRLRWLDGAIAALGMAALCSGVAFHGLERLFEGAPLAVATNLAYPVGDLLLLGVVAGSIVVVPARTRAVLVLLGIGLAINAAGDTFNFVGDGSSFGAVVNAIAWPTSILVFATSMWVTDDGSNLLALNRLSGFVWPGLVSCASLVILVVGNVYDFGPIAIGLASATLALAGIRLAFRPALRRVRESYRVLFERNPQPIVAYDRETLEIVAVSDAMVAKYGYTREECLAMTIKDLVPPEDVPALLAVLKANPQGAHPGLAATNPWLPRHHRLKDGTLIDVEVTSENVTLEGRECRIAFYNDVTERNKAAAEVAAARDEAVEASNLKSAFLANVSHEIRTPMNGVIGMTEILLDMELGDEQRECAEQLAQSGEHMLALINDILDLSKIETGHLELDVADFELVETVERACCAARAQARSKPVRLSVQIGEEVPRRVRGDERRLGQILMNLLSNAVKFTAAGTVTVSVSADRRAQRDAAVSAGTRIRAAVADTGIGIDPAHLERMFEPFTQADVSTTRHYGGTGLGLAISRELVELMGGTIGAESQPGHGSTFWFEIVFADALSEALLPRPTVEAGGSELTLWASPPLVLVAEDSQINQIVAVRALERCGCQVHVAADGHEALRAVRTRSYDAVLMDCQMPTMDGYQATAELRRHEQAARHTPVIAMTAHAMDVERQRCLDAGMDDYITKPMRYAELTAALRRWIPVTATSAADSASLPLTVASG